MKSTSSNASFLGIRLVVLDKSMTFAMRVETLVLKRDTMCKRSFLFNNVNHIAMSWIVCSSPWPHSREGDGGCVYV